MTDQEYVELEDRISTMHAELTDAEEEYFYLEERTYRLETYISKQREAIKELENKIEHYNHIPSTVRN